MRNMMDVRGQPAALIRWIWTVAGKRSESLRPQGLRLLIVSQAVSLAFNVNRLRFYLVGGHEAWGQRSDLRRYLQFPEQEPESFKSI